MTILLYALLIIVALGAAYLFQIHRILTASARKVISAKFVHETQWRPKPCMPSLHHSRSGTGQMRSLY